MTIYTMENGQKTTITLRAWNGNSFGEDFFHEVETEIKNGQFLPHKKVMDLMEYWMNEVNNHNHGKDTEQFENDHTFLLLDFS